MKTYTDEEMKQKNLKPLENAKQENVNYDGVRDCVSKMYKQEGIKGFYKGLTPTIVKIFPASGLFFLAYELTLSNLTKI